MFKWCKKNYEWKIIEFWKFRNIDFKRRVVYVCICYEFYINNNWYFNKEININLFYFFNICNDLMNCNNYSKFYFLIKKRFVWELNLW